MLRSSTRKGLAILGVSVVAASIAVGAIAAPKGKGPSSNGGKKPIGTIASFDAAGGTLVVDMNDGTQFTGTVTEDTQIKVDHRGKPAQKGNPTTGTTEDLVAGYKVLRLKSEEAEDGSFVVEKVKVRRVETPTPAPTTTTVPSTTTTVPVTTTTVPATTTTTTP